MNFSKLIEQCKWFRRITKKLTFRDFINLSRNLIAIKTLPTKVKSYPAFIQIEPTTRCNLKCRMCPRSSVEKGDMSFEQYKKIIDEFPHKFFLMFVGIGEPFLHKDIFKMIRYAKEKNKVVTAFSNGTLLNKEIRKKIIESGLDGLWFSVDGATKETYEKIRKGSNFENVIGNIASLVEEVKESNYDMSIKLCSVRMKENIYELPDIVSLVSTLGIKEFFAQDIELKYLEGVGDENHEWFLEQILYLNPKKEYTKILQKTFERGKKLGVNVIMYKNFSYSKVRTSCSAPWKFVYIRFNGDINPCCFPFKNPFGNIFETPFEEIWNNEKYVEFRKRMKSKNLPKMCINCVKLG